MAMTSGSMRALGPHGFHRIAYVEWGERANPRVAVCVHGLTRQGRDFDDLARALMDVYRVGCPDIVGRGRSEWLSVPADYGYPLYLSDMAAFIARLGVEEVDWVGTSMGGLIGLLLAAQPNSPIRRLVMNDVGPFIPRAALERIGQYVGSDPRFAALDGVEAHLRRVHAPFGPLTDEQWRHLAKHSACRLDGGYRLAYDPAIALPFQGQELQDVNLWPVWDSLRCPVLVLRGAESDLLLHETMTEMAARGFRVDTVEFPGIGHAPALMAQDQIAVIRDWLLATR